MQPPPGYEPPFTPEQIVELRRDLVAQHSESDKTERADDAGCVDGAMGSALQGAFYLADGGALDHIHIAAYLLFYIAKRHCFTDGNKRVAWAVVVDYLLRQGLEITASEEEAADFVIAVVENRVNQAGVIEWLGRDGRLKPYSPSI